MPQLYPSGTGSNIGTLLRLIQEDKSQAPAAQVPAADPNSPIRQITQSPLQSPNDPTSDRVVSLRPEGVNQPVGPGEVIPAGGALPPSAAPNPSVVSAGVYTPPPPGAPPPSFGTPPPSSAPSVQASAPPIGTRITTLPQQRPSSVRGVSVTPQSSRVGGIISTPNEGGTILAPTPTPGQPKKSGKTSSDIPWYAYLG